MEKLSVELKLDYDWVVLIKEAKKIGMTVEEIRLFLQSSKEGA
ncbi:anti-repressor SinI family protein [Oceanobacillus luteolus]|uniref:Anti-repressor SinI family protein n=1 Tax=Oceanobacillus luteolus TaxID=1274358 RepID=A0ABW4HR71_9BACI|nr:anti-repressor SinI family protein [Oceanobacillus luteolus]MCM3740242.1 anti-repressor SinI family protein [Oceanobacillus luteolus]